VRARLRRLPIAVLVGGLWAALDPNGRWIAGVFGAIVVVLLPDVHPWVMAHLKRPGEVPASLRHPGGSWLPGTAKRLDGGIRWRATVDVEPSEVLVMADRFRFGGYTRDEGAAGLDVLQLLGGGGGQLDLAVPPDHAQRMASAFRLASSS
jgi:hypothetical protein